MSQVELFSDDRAKNYTNFVDSWIPGYDFFMNMLPQILREDVEKNILVVGCGTGNEIQSLIKGSKGWNITGIDPSPEMLAQAIEKFKGNTNVQLVEGLLSDIEFSNKFSSATLLLVLHFMKDDGSKLDLLKDIYGNLKPGGTFVLLDISGDKEEFLSNLDVLRLLVPKHVDIDEVNWRLGRIKQDLHPVSAKRMSELFAEAGFESSFKFFQNAIYSGWLAKKR